MFIGHHAVAFASKRFAPRTSLGFLMGAALLLDILWPVFLLLDLEHVQIVPGKTPFLRLNLYDYPWSHSLVMSLVWSFVFGGGYWLITRYTPGAVVIGLAVFSHWVLDFVSHSPDMPLYPGGPKFGLGLWNSTFATILVESILFVVGVGIYFKNTTARDRIGKIATWGFIGFILAGYIASILCVPPTDPKVMGWGGMVNSLLLIWVFWFDRHRKTS